MFEMLAGRSPFDIVGNADNPDQNTEDYLFQGNMPPHDVVICWAGTRRSKPLNAGGDFRRRFQAAVSKVCKGWSSNRGF